jgi:hypothetical protein
MKRKRREQLQVISRFFSKLNSNSPIIFEVSDL